MRRKKGLLFGVVGGWEGVEKVVVVVVVDFWMLPRINSTLVRASGLLQVFLSFFQSPYTPPLYPHASLWAAWRVFCFFRSPDLPLTFHPPSALASLLLFESPLYQVFFCREKVWALSLSLSLCPSFLFHLSKSLFLTRRAHFD